MDSSIPFFLDRWTCRLWQCGQRIATETPLIGRVPRSRTAGRSERLAGKNSRSGDESRAVSWRGMPRQKAGCSHALVIFPRTGYIRASAAATPKTRPRISPQRAASRFLPAFPWSRAGHRKPAIGSTASKPADIVRACAHIHHKTGFQLQAFRSFSFPLHYGSYQPPSGETQHQNCKKIVYYILLIPGTGARFVAPHRRHGHASKTCYRALACAAPPNFRFIDLPQNRHLTFPRQG
jgi:hypothetical protein